MNVCILCYLSMAFRMALTEEQKARMERGKAEALAKKRLRECQTVSSGPSPATAALMATLNNSNPGSLGNNVDPSKPASIEPHSKTVISILHQSNHNSNYIPGNPTYIQQKVSVSSDVIEAKKQEALARKAQSSSAAIAPSSFYKAREQGLNPRALGTNPRATQVPPRNPLTPGKSQAGPIQPPSSGKVVHGSCSLVSVSRFEVTVGYHPQLVEVFKSLASSQYQPSTRLWTFSLGDHDTLLQKARGLAPGLQLTALPTWVLKTFKKPQDQDLESISLDSLEPGLLSQLMPFQITGVQFGISRGGR